VARGGAIAAEDVIVVEELETPDDLAVQVLGVGRTLHVRVRAEQFVGTFACK
jgi:hypothetical protein